MLALRLAFSNGIARCAHRNCPVRLTASVRCQSCRATSSHAAVGPATPALLTSASRPPSVDETVSKRRAMAAGSATSHTLCVRAGSLAASAPSAAASTSQTCTRAPSLANARAVASPMPDAPAVTSTRRLRMFKSMGRRRARGNSFGPLVARIDKRAALHYNYERSCPTREDPNHARPTRPHPPSAGGTMNEPTNRTRRGVLKAGAAVAALGTLGFPAISRGQAEAIRIGHLTPLTGFLGPLGEYAVMGVKLAVDEVNARRWRHGPQDRADRRGQRQPADGVDQGRAADRARQGRRDHRRDQLGVGPRDRDRSRNATRSCSSTPGATPTSCAARRAIATCSTPRPPTRCTCTPPDRRCCATAWSRARSGTA